MWPTFIMNVPIPFLAFFAHSTPSSTCMDHENQKHLNFGIVSYLRLYNHCLELTTSFSGFHGYCSLKNIYSFSGSSHSQSLCVIIWPGTDQILTPLDSSGPLDQVLAPANIDSFVKDLRQDFAVVSLSLSPVSFPFQNKLLTFTPLPSWVRWA